MVQGKLNNYIFKTGARLIFYPMGEKTPTDAA